MPNRRPRVGADAVALDQGGHRIDVVGARQRQRAPPVAAGQQSRGAPGGNLSAGGQAQHGGASAQQLLDVDVDAQLGGDVACDPARVLEHGCRHCHGRHHPIVAAAVRTQNISAVKRQSSTCRSSPLSAAANTTERSRSKPPCPSGRGCACSMCSSL